LHNPTHDSGSDSVRRQMSQFFDATTDGIVFLDRDYRITFLNKRAAQLLSPGGEILGTKLFETFPAAVYDGSPFLDNYVRSMEGGEATEFETFYPEPLNMTLHVQSYPAENGIIIFFRDVSENRASQEALRHKTEEVERQHAELETIYRTAPIGLALFDLDDYRYLRLNDRQAAFFGLRPEDIVGRTVTEMAPITGLRELFDRVAGGEPVISHTVEGTLVTDPGEYRYWTVSYFPVYGPDGKIQAITAASLEITQQKKAELALFQSEKLAAVGRLASSIAHEINNPLEAVTNLMYLARSSDDMVEVHALLDAAEIELRRVSAITAQTLRFHKQASSPQAVTAAQLMDSVLSIYQGRILNSRVRVSRRMRGTAEFRCFEGEIRQVLSNLVSNALDAMPEGGRLLLRSRLGRHWETGERGVVMTVADTGVGMSPATREKLFHAFFTTKGLTGTGLGLWVTKEIVARHHGTLHLRSSQSPQHHGTVFSLFLPFEAVTR
jgi:PAS domain S-box-containing protein